MSDNTTLLTDRSEVSINKYIKALASNQTTKSRNIRVMLVGHEGSGKTCLCKNLLDENIPPGGPKSTDGIDIYIERFVIDIDTKNRSKLDVGTEHETALHKISNMVNALTTEDFLQKHGGMFHQNNF